LGYALRGRSELKLLTRIFLFAVLLVAVAGAVIGLRNYSAYMEMEAVVNQQGIYPNISINGIDVSGLGKPEALAKVSREFVAEIEGMTVTVLGGGKEFVYKFAEFSPWLDFSKAVEKAYDYAREGTLEERYSEIMALENVPNDITYDPPYTYDSTAVKEKIGVIAEHVKVEPINATINRVNGEYVTTSEVAGTEMDVDATAQSVEELLADRIEGTVEVSTISIPAELTEEYVSQARYLIGTYSTSFTAGATGRNTNIKNASSKIDSWTLQPGEVFSTNEALGPTTAENGYASAPVIIGGKLEEDLGGGVCQVSSTLYNAVLFSELEIVERTNHSMKVGYLPYAYDATLAGDYLDFKFKNDTDLPIFVESYIKGNNLVCNIYGKEIHESGHTVEFFNEHVETIPPSGEKVINDPSLPRGARVVKTAAKDGVRYNLYKNVYENGVKISTEKVNSSYYKPVVGEVRIGTGPPAPDPEPEPEPVPEQPAQSQQNESAQGSQEAPAITEPDSGL
jgi:vancomycin resistance protein YoaR